MSVEANKALVRRFVEQVLGRGDFAALAELAAPDCVDHAAAAPGRPGLAAIAGVVVVWRAAFPDLAVEVEDLLADGERVAVRSTVRGTHRGDFFGLAPTGRPLAVTALAHYRLAGGRIVERWAVVDTLEVLRQLGVPSPLPADGQGAWRVPGPI